MLRFAGGEGVLYDRPLTAKVISVSVATLVAWLGNRALDLPAPPTGGRGTTRLLLFFGFNGRRPGHRAGLTSVSPTTSWTCSSPLADNIAPTVIGIGLGTLFRFWAYRRFVFSKDELLEDTSPARQHRAGAEAQRHPGSCSVPRLPLGGLRPRRTPRGTARRSPAGPG